MNVPVSLEMLLGLLIGCVSIIIVVLLMRLRGERQFDRLSQPAYEYMRQSAEQEAATILAEAKQNAATVRESAETERAELIQAYQTELQAMRSRYTEAIDAAMQEQTEAIQKLESKHAQTLHDSVADTTAAFTSVLEPMQSEMADLKTAMATTRSEVEEAAATMQTTLSHSVEAAVSDMKTALHDQQTTVKEELATHSQAALAAVDTATEAYQTHREQIVDTHITQIIEEVAKQVLHTELSVHEHAKLAREALAAAKQDGVL